MKILSSLRSIVIILLFMGTMILSADHAEDAHTWAIIGFGPAGIVTAGLLLDLGVPAKNIICVDPEFNVGRLGQYYSNVPSNTKTKLFVNFIKACKTFQECKSAAIDMLYTYDQDFEYPLRIIIDPLKDISDYLRTKLFQ